MKEGLGYKRVERTRNELQIWTQMNADFQDTKLKALIGELEPIEANRFISMPRKKRIESIKRHREWQRSLDKEKFFNKVFS